MCTCLYLKLWLCLLPSAILKESKLGTKYKCFLKSCSTQIFSAYKCTYINICKYRSNLIPTGLNDMHSAQQFIKLLGIMKNGITDSVNSTLS